jgi:hypothetical protein
MKKLLMLLVILGITATAFGKLKPKQIVGKWTYTVQTEQGDMTGFLKFAEKDGKLTGQVITDDGNVFDMEKIEIKDDALNWQIVPDYDPIKVSMIFEGKKYKATGSTYEGEFPVTGEKVE